MWMLMNKARRVQQISWLSLNVLIYAYSDGAQCVWVICRRVEPIDLSLSLSLSPSTSLFSVLSFAVCAYVCIKMHINFTFTQFITSSFRWGLKISSFILLFVGLKNANELPERSGITNVICMSVCGRKPFWINQQAKSQHTHTQKNQLTQAQTQPNLSPATSCSLKLFNGPRPVEFIGVQWG